MNTQFAKIVTDAYGVDHMLIEGRLITLHAPPDENNRLVDIIVRGLRNQRQTTVAVSADTAAALGVLPSD